MATIKERLQDTIKSCMKSGDKDTLQFARSLHAAIRKVEIDNRATPGASTDLDDTGVIAVISTLVKQRQDSIEQAKKVGRADVADKETAELTFLQTLLPAPLTDAELAALVQKAIADAGAKGPKDMGAVMKLMTPQTQGRADGKKVSQAVKDALAKL